MLRTDPRIEIYMYARANNPASDRHLNSRSCVTRMCVQQEAEQCFRCVCNKMQNNPISSGPTSCRSPLDLEALGLIDPLDRKEIKRPAASTTARIWGDRLSQVTICKVPA